MSPILYSVNGYKGAHIVLATRSTEAGSISDVQLIGALESFSVPTSELTPFDHSAAMTTGDPITLLAQEAATVYNLDPKRVQRAAELARNPFAIQNARRDENDKQITPSLRVQCVKGSKGWYVVRPNFCTCPDHQRGNTCKHRIAAWIHREAITRPIAQARHITPAEVFAELTA